MRKIIPFMFAINMFSILYATKTNANDSIILYSLEKTIELNFYGYSEKKTPTNTDKLIYWLYVSDVDIENNEWQFAYIKTNRRNTYIVKDFEVDTIIDKKNYLLFINYNNLIFNDNEHNDIVIDSLIFSEEPMGPLSQGGIFILIPYCTIRYYKNKKFELTTFRFSPFDVPIELKYFRFQALHTHYKYLELETVNYTLLGKNKLVIENSDEKKYTQKEYIKIMINNNWLSYTPIEIKRKFK